MKRPMIPVFRPLIEKAESEAAARALKLGWLGMGSLVGEFERRVQKYLKASSRFVAAVSTGHAALHTALLVAGVGPGDEVITPSFNNIADLQAILATGAKPVFCDVEEPSLCIDLKKAEGLVGAKTKAIIVMDYACQLCDHDRVRVLAKQHRLRVVHDAVHSFGSKYRGKPCGSFSDIAIFSFDPVKTITCIDGGLLVVRSRKELERVREIRLIGTRQKASTLYQNRRSWTYDVGTLGFRYHMANLHAAIGLAQLKKMKEISKNRRQYCRYYNQALKNVGSVKVPATDFLDITPFIYYLRVPAAVRDSLRRHLARRGVDTGIHWQPGHWFTLFKRCRRGDLSITDRIGAEILTLPLHSKMEAKTLDRVVHAVRSFF